MPDPNGTFNVPAKTYPTPTPEQRRKASARANTGCFLVLVLSVVLVVFGVIGVIDIIRSRGASTPGISTSPSAGSAAGAQEAVNFVWHSISDGRHAQICESYRAGYDNSHFIGANVLLNIMVDEFHNDNADITDVDTYLALTCPP